MSTQFVNQAAWQTAANTKPLKVGPGPDQSNPASDEVVIKVEYVAINPSEWKMQDFNYLPLQFPHVLGSDVAGIVVKTGDAVTRFKDGDRVIGHCLGLMFGGARHGGFQHYTTCREIVVAKVPDSVPLESAVVLPLGLSTSITGLFEILKLDLPTSSNAEKKGKTVLIWGGSSSMGSTAIQLAVAAGYDVVSTASKRNHEYVKDLGAQEVFDHTDPEVVEKISGRLQGFDVAGICDSIGEESSIRACAAILSSLGGGIFSTVLWPPNDLPENVNAIMVYASNPGLVPDHVGITVWRDFVESGLRTGALRAKPEPRVLTGGLDVVQDALELQKKGVSAKKIVVRM
ncbi:uncharacterized protein A1O9_06019 [Exophiala aquamarina CBS 119918]|uniref:Enoyl reductase (ER) domain-containing protein n=1 Tax=Exophiala aquamarina CBS 119918 TaxID=1182545 RepID=A0A072PDZ7_9EURO|nr:uncharacterized protein A1O9_06019 [Exophiala aquamarina CBS 119918]KEF58096.1 hypothetical protein A1O9_06019 [Exophiala aquamarina CBS 119918]